MGAGPTAGPTSGPTSGPTAGPTRAPTPSECDYTDIDFETTGDGAPTGTSNSYVASLSWSAYGVTINAYSTNGGFTTVGNLTRFLDTEATTKDLVDPNFGSPNVDCGGRGTGAGGTTSNCVGLGNVLIVQENESTAAMSNPGGGDIVFTFDDATTMLKLTVFNVQSGGEIIFKKTDGAEKELTIPVMAANEVRDFEISEADVETMTVHFVGVGAVTNIGICRDPDAAPSPMGLAPPIETEEPSASPTPPPIQELIPIPPTDCPADVVLLHVDGDYEFENLPIVILEQNIRSVKFRVQNTLNTTITRIFTQYHETPTGETECFQQSEVAEKEFVEYTAYCMQHVHISIVDIWVSGEPLNPALDTAEIPICCHPPDGDGIATVQYTFKLRCETECPPDELPLTRHLGETPQEAQVASSSSAFLSKAATNVAAAAAATNKNEQPAGVSKEDGHFCAPADYPCGENGDLVHVCHYSSKDGYQTFCVPEADSDVLSFYPKDYCGRCVGGYTTDRHF
jgi:hypothetical protein